MKFPASAGQILQDSTLFLELLSLLGVPEQNTLPENKVFSIFPNEESQPLGHQLKHTHVRQ